MKLYSLVGVFLCACGPSVAVTRTASYAPLPDNCSVEIVEGDIGAQLVGPYELIGDISFGQWGDTQPFSKEHMAKIQPNVCKLGGNAVALVVSARDGWTLTSYWVLRRRPPPGVAKPGDGQAL
jgi:hypothetical protein